MGVADAEFKAPLLHPSTNSSGVGSGVVITAGFGDRAARFKASLMDPRAVAAEGNRTGKIFVETGTLRSESREDAKMKRVVVARAVPARAVPGRPVPGRVVPARVVPGRLGSMA